jgi:hypothetical protein
MSLWNDVKGTLRIFVEQAHEEFYYMDKKLIRIGAGVLSFIIAGAIWYFFFRNINPFF